MIPIILVALLVELLSPPKLKIKIPIEMNRAITILSLPNFRALSLTLEQKNPTNTTGMMLQDFIIITIGKLVILIASILDNADTVTKIAHKNIFRDGTLVEG